MTLKFDEWKETVFKTKLFQDVFEFGKQQKIAATISGVRSVANLSSQGFFASSKKPSDTPARIEENRPVNPSIGSKNK